MQNTLTTLQDADQQHKKAEEQRKVDDLFAQMTPAQRLNTLAWMMGLLAGRSG